MRCSVAHSFRPFPGTLVLYCTACGAKIGVPTSAPSPSRSASRKPSPSFDSPQQSLGLTDEADVGEARAILERQQFEAAVEAIINASGMSAEDAGEWKARALDFGPGLDLDNFAALALEQGRANPETDTLA